MKKVLFSLICSLTLASCSLLKPYHMDIPQGTQLTEKQMNQIQIGTTKKEVIDILGKPQLSNAFDHDNRLDYVNTLQKNGGVIEETRFTVIFEHNKVVKIVNETYPKDASK